MTRQNKTGVICYEKGFRDSNVNMMVMAGCIKKEMIKQCLRGR